MHWHFENHNNVLMECCDSSSQVAMQREEFRQALRGIFVTTVTPFNSDLSVSEQGIRANVRFLVENEVNVITPCGSIGEWSSLTREEAAKVISATVDEAGGKVPVLAGASSTSTMEAAERAKIAEKAGADAILLLPAFYMKYSLEGLIRHFRMVANNTSLPIVLYNAPDFLGFELSTAELVRIVDEVDGIVAIKDATTDMLEFSNRLRVLKKVDVLLGNEPYCYHGLVAGSSGVFNSVSNFAPHLMKKIYAAVSENRISEAREIYSRLTEYFAFRRGTKNPIAVVKQSMVRRGIKIEPFVRPPLAELSKEQKEELTPIVDGMLESR